MCPETVTQNCTTVVGTRILNCAANIIDDEQGAVASFVWFDTMIIISTLQGKFEAFGTAAIFDPRHLVQAEIGEGGQRPRIAQPKCII